MRSELRGEELESVPQSLAERGSDLSSRAGEGTREAGKKKCVYPTPKERRAAPAAPEALKLRMSLHTPPTSFVEPQKSILNKRFPMEKFRFTKVYYYITNFVQTVQTVVQGKAYADCPAFPEDGVVRRMGDVLDKVVVLFEETPPTERTHRYGNPSFRTFMQKVHEHVDDWHRELLPPELHPAIVEFRCYFLDMFGSEGRMDYGTGHELNFLAWVFCFVRLELLGSIQDLQAVGLFLMPKYLRIAQLMQNVYTLEPAGSHGAWSVDDYNMVPFVWGASQLEGTDFGVRDIFDQEKVEAIAHKNLYTDMLSNILTVKTGSLTTTTPFLSELHYIPGQTWKKISSGMLKHFEREVMCKWPVMQHFWFGNILPLE